jgi:hypothetical protein
MLRFNLIKQEHLVHNVFFVDSIPRSCFGKVIESEMKARFLSSISSTVVGGASPTK